MFSFILCLIGSNFNGAKPFFLWFQLVPKSQLVKKSFANVVAAKERKNEEKCLKFERSKRKTLDPFVTFVSGLANSGIKNLSFLAITVSAIRSMLSLGFL